MTRGLAAGLLTAALAGIPSLFLRLKTYWVARYHRAAADLQGAELPLAPSRSSLSPSRAFSHSSSVLV
jgi:hypothetical protein